MKIEIKSRWDNKIILCGEYESIKDCLEKNRGANLRGANLRGANLRDAYLRGTKNYYMSHDFAMELIRRMDIKSFTDKEWAVIGQLTIHRFCYDTIRKKYKPALSIFKKLKKEGYGEYLDKLEDKCE